MKISVLHISDKKPSRALRKVGKKKRKKSKKIFEYPNKVTPQTPEKKKTGAVVFQWGRFFH